MDGEMRLQRKKWGGNGVASVNTTIVFIIYNTSESYVFIDIIFFLIFSSFMIYIICYDLSFNIIVFRL